jgi:hypothetical protein
VPRVHAILTRRRWLRQVANQQVSAIAGYRCLHRVGRTYQHTNREILIEGDPLPVRLRRSRTAKGVR